MLSVVAVIVVLIVIGAAVGAKKKTPATAASGAVIPAVATSAPPSTAPAAAAATQSAPAPAAAPKSVAPAPAAAPKSVAPAGPTGAFKDVTIKSCVRDPDDGTYTANLLVLNHSSKTSNYIISIGVQSADGTTKYDNLLGSVDNLAPGQSSPQQAVGFSPAPAGSVCTLDDVTRYAS